MHKSMRTHRICILCIWFNIYRLCTATQFLLRLLCTHTFLLLMRIVSGIHNTRQTAHSIGVRRFRILGVQGLEYWGEGGARFRILGGQGGAKFPAGT